MLIDHTAMCIDSITQASPVDIQMMVELRPIIELSGQTSLCENRTLVKRWVMFSHWLWLKYSSGAYTIILKCNGGIFTLIQ